MTRDNQPRFLMLGFLFGWMGLIIPLPALAADITARLSPDRVAVGEYARLDVQVDLADGNAQARPLLPSVGGLEFEPAGQSSRTSVVNGQISSSATFTYLVSAEEPGTFQISGIHHGSAQANPVTLTVTKAGAAASQSRSSSQSQNLASAQAPKPTGAGELAFLRLDLPKQRLYSGQSIPIKLRAYFRGGTGVTLTGMPSAETDAFTISGLDSEPAQSRTTIHGQDYLAVTWQGVLTAVKTGTHDLSVRLPATVQYHEVSPRVDSSVDATGPMSIRSLMDMMMRGDPFSDDLFEDFSSSMLRDPFLAGSMFGHRQERVVTRDLTLTARERGTEVIALPTSGRPVDFTGAVGRFEVEAALDRTQLVSGEPASLKISVSGRGNFDRVANVALNDSQDWRAYAARSTLNATRGGGYEDTKVFEQSVVARHPDVHALPAISFSYFDPEAERYVTKTTAPIQVSVEAGAKMEPVLAQAQDAASEGAPSPRANVGRTVPSLAYGGVPAWLLPTALGLLLLCLLALLVSRLRRSHTFRAYLHSRELDRAARRHRSEVSRAAERTDAAAFFSSARRVLQHRLAKTWRVAPESITLAELTQHWPQAPEDLREIFQLADEAEYFPGSLREADLEGWAERLDRLLVGLKAPRTTLNANAATMEVST